MRRRCALKGQYHAQGTVHPLSPPGTTSRVKTRCQNSKMMATPYAAASHVPHHHEATAPGREPSHRSRTLVQSLRCPQSPRSSRFPGLSLARRSIAHVVDMRISAASMGGGLRRILRARLARASSQCRPQARTTRAVGGWTGWMSSLDLWWGSG
jgi:hypothetical protein